MKFIYWFSAFLLFISTYSTAQVEVGIKAGVSSYDLADDFQHWRDANKTIEDEIIDSSYGFHFGMFVRVNVFGIYLEPSLIFNSNDIKYNVEETNDIFNSLKDERFQSLDIPLMAGFKVWFFRVQAGPVAHIYIDNSNELIEIEEYKEKLRDAKYGYQAGVGLDIGRIRVDANYEGNFSNFAETLKIGNEEITIEDRADRIIITLGYRF